MSGVQNRETGYKTKENRKQQQIWKKCFFLSYFGYLVVCTKCSLTYNIKCYVSWLLEQPSKEMCCEVVLFVPMLLCNWAVIWMPLLIFPYVLSLVVQMQLDPHVNPIPSTNCLSVCLAICLLTCLPGCISTADMMVVNTHTRARAHAHARTHTHVVQLIWCLTVNMTYEHNRRTSTGLNLLSERRRAPPRRSYSGSLQAVFDAHHGDLTGQSAWFHSPRAAFSKGSDMWWRW